MNLCACGCETAVASNRKFVSGHNGRGVLRKPQIEKTCIHCKTIFSGTERAIGSRVYCSSACRDDFRRGRTGDLNPYYRSVETTCSICSKTFTTNPARLGKVSRLTGEPIDVYCSMECGREGRRRKVSGKARKARPFGKRGAKVRDGFACRICGFDLFVHAHHIVARKDGGSHAHENLISLCPNHHAMAHAGLLSVDEMREAITKPAPESARLLVRAKHAINYRGH